MSSLRKLDMFDQCLPKRLGTSEPRRPHGRHVRPCNYVTVPHEQVVRSQKYGLNAKRLDRLAGRH